MSAMRVVVAGAGIVGLACAEELVRSGHDVRVVDPSPGTGATHAAAGMLAPAGEAWHGEDALLGLGLASAAAWPDYAARLSRDAGVEVGHRATGTVLVGVDRDDLLEVDRTLEVLRSAGVAHEGLDRHGLRALEPGLARAAGGALLPDDHSVAPRQVVLALERLVGDRLVRAEVAGFTAHGVRLADGSHLDCDLVVVATGAQARAWLPWVRPVRGETIRVLAADPPRHVLRARVHGEPVYVVPRAGGEVVVGASQEEHPGEPVATVGAVSRLLDAARTLLPGLETAALLEVTARHRPGTPDNGPAIGPHPRPGEVPQVLAVGHHRGGVLLAPVTAAAVRAHVEGTPVPEVARPFHPARFARPDERESGPDRKPHLHPDPDTDRRTP